MLISTKGRYALRILIDMTEQEPGVFIPLRGIAERQGISEKYLESIVKELVKNNIVIGQRGKGGGYRLCVPPEKINVGEVLSYLEGSLAPVSCLADGTVRCPRSDSCATLDFWRGLDEVINGYTAKFTIADLINKR